MRTPVQVGTWPVLGLDGNGKPVPGPSMVVAWRRLSWKEYDYFRVLQEDPKILYAEVYEKCLVRGPSLEKAPAGIVFHIGKQELETCPFSGRFDSISKELEKARTQVQGSWLLTAQALIACTLHYSLDEVATWPADLFFQRVALAEQLAGKPLDPADPKNPPQAPSRRKRGPSNPATTPRAPQSGDNQQFTFTR